MIKEWNKEQRIEDFMKRKPEIFTEELVEFMITNGFFTAPASRDKHGAFEGGNFWHSRMVAMLIREYTDRMELKWERPESPEIIGWLHDICKMDEYIKIGEENEKYHYERRRATELWGHGNKSAILAMSKMYITDEEIRCICWHMGAFGGKETWNDYCYAVKKYPNILWVHQADMVASQVRGI